MTVERYQPHDAEVVDGEVVDEQPRQAGPVRVLRPLAEVVRHERTRRAGWRGVEAAVTTVQGLGSWGQRAWDAGTLGVYRRQIRAAEAAGDAEALADWVQRRELAVERRHKRLLDLPKTAAGLARVVLGSLAALVVLVLLCGLVVQLTGEGTFTGIVLGFLGFLRWAATAVVALWTPLVAVAPFAILAAAYREGRRRAEPPRWVARHVEPEDRAAVPDEGAILAALSNLGLAPLNKAVREGWQPRWVSPAMRDGQGWRAQLQLPQGCTVDAVNDRKHILAHNLLRKPNEVWPTEPRNKPGVLDVWVADQGLLDGPVGRWPLADDGTGDYFAGIPVGIDQRGELVVGKLMASNYLVGGIMGSGKSSLVVTLILGALLDPLVDVRVHVMAYNIDYDPMAPALARLVKGDEDEHLEAALDALRWLRGEVSRRGQVLEELGGDTKLTREVAARRSDMRPIVAVFDEVQELFEHDKYGKEARDLAVALTKKARKTGITCVWSTPTAGSTSLPRDLSRTASHLVAFAINDHVGNDAILGTGAHKAGISATSLVAGEDVGTAMAVGFRREAGLLRCFHLERSDDVDEVTPVVARALEARGGAERPVTVEQRDLLGDVRQVLGDEAERATQVAARLRDRGWQLNGTELVDRLHRDHGIPPRKLKGYAVIRRDDLAGVDDDEAPENPL